jgi:hypothetical protein
VTDLQATLDAIDELAVHQCGYCSTPLPVDGESLDYCDDRCQAAWLSERHEVQELVGYREPYDLPVYQSNLVELYSPEVTPDRHGLFQHVGGCLVPDFRRAEASLRVFLDASSAVAAFERAAVGFRQLWESVSEAQVAFRGVPWDGVVFDEIHNWQPTGIRTESVAGSPEPEEPFGSDFDFEWTPATSLPHEPPAAVMPPAPERDWQALVDSYSLNAGPARPVRAPRHLGRTR